MPLKIVSHGLHVFYLLFNAVLPEAEGPCGVGEWEASPRGQ